MDTPGCATHGEDAMWAQAQDDADGDGLDWICLQCALTAERRAIAAMVREEARNELQPARSNLYRLADRIEQRGQPERRDGD